MNQLQEALHKAAIERMQTFDDLPPYLREYANEHGLRKALIKQKQHEAGVGIGS